MNNIQVFNNKEFGEIRLNEKGVATADTPTNGGMQTMSYINESNLYKLIFQSRKAEAEKFTEWVTSEVLPDIRRYGMYATDELVNNSNKLQKKLNNIVISKI